MWLFNGLCSLLIIFVPINFLWRLYCINHTLLIQRLRDHGCTVEDMLKIPQADLEKLLIPVGFYKVFPFNLRTKTLNTM